VQVTIEQTTVADPDFRPLVTAQEAEVMVRYGADDVGLPLSPEAACLLARLDGRPVGCVAVAQLEPGVGELKRLYVEPAARGRRVGRRLLQQAEALAALHGYRSLRLETGTEQPESVRLYEGAGWLRIECYGYFKDDPSTLCFEKAVGVSAG
jgi:GNAT superfamily N-acetyltransferase